MKGLSGSPILKATGVIGMLVASDGAHTTAASYDTLLQVLKRYYMICLRQVIIRLKQSNFHNFLPNLQFVLLTF